MSENLGSPTERARNGDQGDDNMADEQVSVADLELRLSDALADPDFPPTDKAMFQELTAILGRARRAEGVVSKKRRLILLRPGTPSNGSKPS